MGVLGAALIVLASADLLGADAYYHIQFANLVRQNGLVHEFPWAQASFLGSHFADKEFLYHLLLVPFTFGDLIAGAKTATGLLAGLAFALFCGLIRSQNCRAPLLWTVVLLCSGSLFIQRMVMTRPHVLSLIILLLAARFLSEGRVKLLGVLGWLYALSYSAPQTLLIMAVFYNLGLLAGRERIRWKTIVYPALGILAGFLTHPNFPNNARLWLLQNLQAPLHAWGVLQPKLNQGVELLPTTGRDFLLGMTAVSVCLVGSVLGYLWRGKRPRARTWAWLGVAGAFLILTLLSMRFTEYFVPFALVFCASAVSDLLEGVDLEGWLENRRIARSVLPSAVLVFLILTGISSVTKVQSFAVKDNHDSLGQAARWLGGNVPPGETVFHTDWGDFPELFFHAPALRFLVGLDPIFMFAESPPKWRLWKSVSEGRRPDAPKVVREVFGSRFILLRTRPRPALDRQLRSAAITKQVFRNANIAIYEILPD